MSAAPTANTLNCTFNLRTYRLRSWTIRSNPCSSL